MKVAIVTVMVVLAMGTAFVGGLLVAAKMTANREERPVERITVAAVEALPKEEGAKAAEGGAGKEAGKKVKKEEKKLSTDELIAMIDYSVTESRDAGKLLFRKKLVEDLKDTEKQFESESEKARKKAELAAALERWLERSKNQ